MAHIEMSRHGEPNEPRQKESVPQNARSLLIKAKALREFCIDHMKTEAVKQLVEDVRSAVRHEGDGKATRTQLYQMAFDKPLAETTRDLPFDLYDETGEGIVASLVEKLYSHYISPEQKH